MLLAKVWYFVTSAGMVFVMPYFNVYFADTLHFNKEQIGALSALRPWLSAGCQVVLCALADFLGAHTAILVLTWTLSVALRCLLMAMPAHFVAVAALVLAADCIGSPVGAIVDATVVGACKNDGDYGKHRMWGSIGWGGLSVAAGWLVGKKGLGAGFAVYAVCSLPCAFIAWKLRHEAAAAATERAASKAAPEGPQKPLAGQGASCTHKQLPSSKTKPLAGTNSTSATAAILCSADPDGFPEDLHVRLLARTPDSSCAGSENEGSVHGGSRADTPEIAAMLPSRPESPFSRYAQCEDLPGLINRSAVPEAARYTPSPLSNKALAAVAANGGSTGRSTPDSEHSGRNAALDPLDRPHGQQEAQCDNAENVDETGRQQQVGPDQQPIDPLLSTAAAKVDPKKSAQLDRSSLEPNQLQPGYSQLDPAQKRSVSKDPDTVAPFGHRVDEGAPLLGSTGQQLLSDSSPADAVNPASAKAVAQGTVTVGSLLVKPAVLVFLWRAVIIGLGLGVIGNFLFLHIEELGGTGTLMGLMLAFNILTEAPAFHLQTYILDKMSVPFVFNASMLMLSVRLAGYGVLPWLHNPWPVLLLELMHGFTFATSWGAGIVHCKRLAPPELNASMQGLFSSLYSGLGSGLGALLGGFLMQALGGQGLFFVCSLVVLGGWLIGFLVEMIFINTQKQAHRSSKA